MIRYLMMNSNYIFFFWSGGIIIIFLRYSSNNVSLMVNNLFIIFVLKYDSYNWLNIIVIKEKYEYIRVIIWICVG